MEAIRAEIGQPVSWLALMYVGTESAPCQVFGSEAHMVELPENSGRSLGPWVGPRRFEHVRRFSGSS